MAQARHESPPLPAWSSFLACLEGRDRLRSDARFRSYLFGVACNTLCAHLRRKYDTWLDLDEVSAIDL